MSDTLYRDSLVESEVLTPYAYVDPDADHSGPVEHWADIETGSHDHIYVVENTTWGPIVGSTTERSNARVLLRAFPNTFVIVLDVHRAETLALRADQPISTELWTVLANLGEYVLLDERDLSELERELAWDADLSDDVWRSLTDPDGERGTSPDFERMVLEWFDDPDTPYATVEDAFLTTYLELGHPLEPETAVSVGFNEWGITDTLNKLAHAVMTWDARRKAGLLPIPTSHGQMELEHV